jgi:endonuclease G
VYLSISIGQPSLGAQPAGVAAPAAAEVEKVVVDQDYSDRPGYDPEFLDTVVVPLPKILPEMEKITARVHEDARRNGDPYELAYYHYSVYMNSARRTAWFSAANVDGKQRPGIGAREGDRWYADTRIVASAQLTQAAFEHGIDRGHLTRRDDTAWGSTVDEAVLANNDTFHFTNCSLQVSGFNRGKDRWQGLEQFLLEQHAKKDKRRMIVITGPVFADDDPPYQNDKMKYTVQFPLKFWKVCVLVREYGSPSATGFLLGQPDAKTLPGVEAFDVGASQMTIADLQDLTKLDFGDLKNYDHFAQGGAAGTIEGLVESTIAGQMFRRIRAGTDIVV